MNVADPIEQIEWVDIDSIHPDPNNANTHPDDNIEDIRNSLHAHGQVEPLLVRRETRHIIHGNGRWETMKLMGWDRCKVIFMDISEKEARELSIRMNRSAESSVWDMNALVKNLAEIRAEGTPMEAMGWTDADVKAMEIELQRLQRGVIPPTDGAGAVPPPPPDHPISQPGEVYRLGRHTLICGSSADWASYEHVPRGIDMVWTDPPYGINFKSIGRSADKEHTIISSDESPEAAEQLMREVFPIAYDYCRPGAVWYTACAPGSMLGRTGLALQVTDKGLWKHTIVWVKDSFVFGRVDRHYKHEAILYGWKSGGGHEWIGGRKRTSVIDHPRPRVSDEHPTMKPLQVIIECLECHPNGTVLDTFGGSGSTLIAADMTGHTAYLIELEPKYCDVIRRRWHHYAVENGFEIGDGLP